MRLLVVASGISEPKQSHWYSRVSGTGSQAAIVDVNSLPTRAVPEITGLGEAINDMSETDVATDVVVSAVYPSRVPVTSTEMSVPVSSAVRT